MAINPSTKYPGKILAPTAQYPYGSAQNVAVPGDGTGTPWEEAIPNDAFGFQQSLLDAAGIVPSGSADQLGASQYMQALAEIAAGRGNFYVDSGVADAYIVDPIVSGAAPHGLVGPASLFDGLTIRFKPGATNTGASTVQVAGLAVKAIVNEGGLALEAGQIEAGKEAVIIYDLTNTRFELLRPAKLGTILAWARVLSTGTQLIDLQQGYGIWSDNVAWGGGAGTRLWIDGPNGGDLIMGPRAGAPDYLSDLVALTNNFKLRGTAGEIDLTQDGTRLKVGGGNVWTTGNTVSQTSGSKAPAPATYGEFATTLAVANYEVVSAYITVSIGAASAPAISMNIRNDGTNWAVGYTNNHATDTVTFTVTVVAILR